MKRLIAFALSLFAMVGGAFAAVNANVYEKTITADYSRKTMAWYSFLKTGSSFSMDKYTIVVPAGRTATVTITRKGAIVNGTASFWSHANDGVKKYLDKKDDQTKYTFTSDNKVTVSVTASAVDSFYSPSSWYYLECFADIDYEISVVYSGTATPSSGTTTGGGGSAVSASAFTAAKAATYKSAVQDNGNVTGYIDPYIGVIELKTAKAKNGCSKVTGTFFEFTGIKYKITGTISTTKSGPATGSLTVKDVGTLKITAMTPSYFTGTLVTYSGAEYKVKNVAVGGTSTKTRTVNGFFDNSDVDYGELIEDALPFGETVRFSGTKCSAEKAGRVTLKKGEITLSEVNPSGLKVSYNSKSGQVSGNFSVYAVNSKGKLVKKNAKFTGFLIDGNVWGTFKFNGSCYFMYML